MAITASILVHAGGTVSTSCAHFADIFGATDAQCMDYDITSSIQVLKANFASVPMCVQMDMGKLCGVVHVCIRDNYLLLVHRCCTFYVQLRHTIVHKY